MRKRLACAGFLLSKIMAKQFTLAEIADFLGETWQGENITITGLNTLEEAQHSELSFLANPKYIKQIATTKAGAVIVHKDHAKDVANAIISENPYFSFARCMGLFAEKEGFFEGISELAFIHPSAVIGKNCTIYPFAVIGADAKLGDNCTIFSGVYIGEHCELGENCTLTPNCVLMSRTRLGDNCYLQPGVVLGGEGFGFVRTDFGIQKIPQIGQVSLADNVEIGANTTIDRAALAKTSIGKSTCIDNLVQIGHNVQIGEECLIISQVGIAGSTKIGNKCTLAGQVGVSGHLHIHDNVTIGPQGGVSKDLAENSVVSGSPTMDYNTYMRHSILQPKIPELFKRVSALEKQIARLEQESDSKK